MALLLGNGPVIEEMLEVNPFAGLNQKEETRELMILLEPKQVEELFSVCKYEHQRLFLLLALTMGMRHGELLSLKWQDIFLDKGFIRLRAENTKARKTRILPLIPFVVEYLKRYKRDSEYVIAFLGKLIVTFRKELAEHKEPESRLSWDASELRIHDLRHNTALTL